MTSRTGMRMRSNTEGVCGNNTVQFQSCDGSSSCTALGENGCTDIVSRQLRDSYMIRRWCEQFTEGRTNVHNEDRSGRPSLVTLEVMESVRQAILQNQCFTISELSRQFPQMSHSLLHDVVSQGQEKRFHNDSEVQTAVTSWLQTLAVDSYDTGIQMLVHR